ncbi:MAG: OB-fold nucleic acid binding domain-containing protein, partial [Solirubrobacteraceae bacterium]
MRPPRSNLYRDAWCGELTAAREGETVHVAGWVNRRRDHGGLIFIDLRDRTGILQLVIHPGHEAFAVAERLRPEHVLSATGAVVARSPETVNANLPTGGIELDVAALEQLAHAETPPFAIDDDAGGGEVDENIRLRHR